MENTIYSQLQSLGLAHRHQKRGAAVSNDKQTKQVRELPKGHSAIRDAIIVLLATTDESEDSDRDQEPVRQRVRAGISKALAKLRKAGSR